MTKGYYYEEPERHRINNSDEAKVARFGEQVRSELTAAITAAGDGGWRSQYYTGTKTPADLNYQQQDSYQQWRTARDNWTQTGDEKYKTELLDAVDFAVPPDISAVPVPEPARRRSAVPVLFAPLAALGLVFAVWIACGFIFIF